MMFPIHLARMNVEYWNHCVECTHVWCHSPIENEQTENIKITFINECMYNFYDVIFQHTKIAFSCKLLATTTTRFVKRASKSGTLSASNRTSLKLIDANGILILPLRWALLNSKWLRRSITAISSGRRLFKLITSFALIRGHRSFCKSFNSISEISWIFKRKIESIIRQLKNE